MARLTTSTLARCFVAGVTMSLAAAACTTTIGDDSDSNRNEALDGVNQNGGVTTGGETTGPGAGPGSTSSGSNNNPTAPSDSLQPGALCNCDSECAAVEGHEGICVFGVCATRASADCSAGGSTIECNAGAQCWGLTGQSGSICFPQCDSFTCNGSCDEDGLCLPTQETSCGYTCGSYCACQPGDCGEGESCISGTCQPDAVVGEGPGPGPGPTCNNLPQRDCTTGNCADLVVFDPRTTPHYDDYPINGETAANQWRSYIRRDLMMLLDHATAKTYCKTAGWTFGNGGALGWGDMSEANGDIPGTAVGQPGHPQNTHTNGSDIDIAYYQVNTPNNYLRPVCEHTVNGQDQYHCTSAATLLDTWRTALFLGYVFESPIVRVIGVDGQVGQPMMAALNELCAEGWISEYGCQNIKLGYEVTNDGLGWYHFHHHHAHISVYSTPNASLLEVPGAMLGIQPGVRGRRTKAHPYADNFGLPLF